VRADASAADDAWFEPVRYVTTRSTFQALAELPSADPLRQPFLSWVQRLAVTRIAGRVILDVARARQDATLELEIPEPGTYSARQIIQRIVAEQDPARVGAWLERLARLGAPILAAERRARETIIEIDSRLGAVEAGLDAPYDRDTLREQARRLLARTDDLASQLFGKREDLARLIAPLVSRDVPGVWPTRSHARWLFEQFQGTALLDGLSLDLGPTPPPLGASSFARALARFGAAYARATAPSGAPFVLARDATEAHPMRRGALFGSLVIDRIFLQKQVGLSREASQTAGRALAATLLAAARLDAMRSLVDFATASANEVHEATCEALKVRILPGLAGVLPRPSASAPFRLAASLLANDDRETLRSRYDEDWFKNPRALLFLRETDAVIRPAPLPKEALEGGAERLARAFEALAG
jgi:hypothetical protein